MGEAFASTVAPDILGTSEIERTATARRAEFAPPNQEKS
jgi:hypothetical protein